MENSKSDVVVLGGGVIGLACALRLLRAGRSVTVLEKGTAGCGSSHGNCGTITPSHVPLHAPGTIARALRWMLQGDAPLYVRPRLDPELFVWMLNFARLCNLRDFRRTALVKSRLLLRSRELLDALIRAEGLDCEFEPSGTLYVWRQPRAFEEAGGEFELLRGLGIPVERMDGAAVRAKEPALNDSIVGGHFHAGDARLRPDRYVAELARVVRSLGGTVLEGAQVEGFHTGNGRIETVVTSAGRFAGGEVVFALGAWSPRLGRQLGLILPIQPGKGYSITYTRPALAPAIPLVLKERSVCVTAWASGYRLGSTMEFSGYDETLNPRRLAALARGAAEYLHEPLGPQMQEQWYGWRPMTYDDLPIIGRAPGYANLTLATGHGMLGVSLSAVTGELVGELLTGAAPSLELAPYSPLRFG
ncbi:MAG: FAD-dependent oxidoreductase [Nevskia sp.]|nr:FAD-dependent oxidoreductase [Nevskia sp.]